MAKESIHDRPGRQQLLAAIVRAILVVGQVGLAVFLVVSAILVRGFGGAIILAIAAVLASAGAVGSVLLWLKGSWHVITMAVATMLLMLCGAVLLLLTSGNPGW